MIIFDCDGVLVDSEALAARVFSDTLADVGIALSPAQCMANFQGRSLADCYRLLGEQFGFTLPQEFDARLIAATASRFNRELRAVAGVEALLRFLQRRSVPFCLASNGGHTKIENSLRTTGLLDYFPASARFSVDDVEQGKPAPDIYQFAAEASGVPPGFCWVVEDSHAGVRAAVAAGMRVLAFLPGEQPAWSSEPSPVRVQRIASMAELQQFFSDCYPGE